MTDDLYLPVCTIKKGNIHMPNTVKFTNNHIKVIAHQGLFGLERGNSNQAFIAAGNRETYYGVETDVQRTADGHYVVIHDTNTKNLTGVDRIVSETTLAELRSLLLFDMDMSHDRVDLRIPTLQEYIKICKYYEKVSILEIKEPMAPEHVREIADILRDMGHLHNTVIISFHRENLVALRAYLPDQAMQYLTTAWNEDVKAFVLKYNLGVDICWPVLNESVFREIKALGLPVNTWNLDDPARAEMYDEWGLDFITTNILEGRNARTGFRKDLPASV